MNEEEEEFPPSWAKFIADLREAIQPIEQTLRMQVSASEKAFRENAHHPTGPVIESTAVPVIEEPLRLLAPSAARKNEEKPMLDDGPWEIDRVDRRKMVSNNPNDDPTAQVAQRITESAISKEIGIGVNSVMGRLAGYLTGDLSILLSPDEGILSEGRVAGRISLESDAQLIRQFVNEITHVASRHGLESTREIIARWQQKIVEMDEELDKIIRGDLE